MIICASLILWSCKSNYESDNNTLDPVDLTHTPVSPNDLALTLSSDSLLVNESNVITLSIKAGIKIITKDSTANVKISPVGKFPDGTKQMQLHLDSKGEAVAVILPDSAGISTVEVTVGSVSRTATIKFISNQVTLSVLNNNVIADNYTYAQIMASTVSQNYLNTGKEIVFISTAGKFSNNSDTFQTLISSDGTAKAYLKDNKNETAIVSATIAGVFTNELQVNFTPAYPGQILINPTVGTLRPLLTSNTIINAALTRNNGSVSAGIAVSFYDSTSTGIHPGAFLNTTFSDQNGMATTQYTIVDTTYTGIVYIKGYVDTGGGSRVYGVNTIIIQN